MVLKHPSSETKLGADHMGSFSSSSNKKEETMNTYLKQFAQQERNKDLKDFKKEKDQESEEIKITSSFDDILM